MRPAAHPRMAEATTPLPRALAALGLLVVLLAVVPVALVALGRALPVDLAALGSGSLLRPDDGALLLVLLLAVAWAAWAVMAVTVGLEAWAAARRVPTPRLPGLAGPQRLASALVASLMVVLASGATTAGAAAATSGHAAAPPLALALARVTAPAAPAPALEAQPAPAARGAAQPPEAIVEPAKVGPSVVAARHDTLWRLAERHLGAGERFAEIVSLNVGVPQPDGRALGPDGRIYPGWTLALPADARHVETVLDLRTPGADESSSTSEHVVERGESLWRIADEELGDPLRYPELFEENRGDRQPDGRHLEDPDLILPGWVLELPSDPAGDVAPGEVAGLGHDERPSVAVPGEDAEPPVRDAQTGPGSPAAERPAERLPDLDRGLPSGTSTMPRAGGATAPRSAPGGDPGTVPAPAATGPTPEETTIERAAPPGAAARPDNPTTIERAATMDPTAVVALADDLDEASALPEGGTLGVLLLAGIAGELARRRRQYQRHRRPGERMPRLSARARAFEATLREHADEADPALLERALVQVSRSARAAGMPVPAVRVVRAARSGVELTLAEEWHEAEPLVPFVAVDGRTWRLDSGLLDAADGSAGDGPSNGPHEDPSNRPQDAAPHDGDLAPGRALPGLVALGTDADQTVLIDLAERGTLRVAGDPDLVADVLRGLTVEASFGPLHTTAARTICLAEPGIADAAEAGEITIATPPEAAAL
ncbi:MAG TPA: hypothetical protein VF143_03060, partial [Candidatus Nanopelagicales bacterium]